MLRLFATSDNQMLQAVLQLTPRSIRSEVGMIREQDRKEHAMHWSFPGQPSGKMRPARTSALNVTVMGRSWPSLAMADESQVELMSSQGIAHRALIQI